ncbi:MAG: B12-binding domain-containing radical SAM protein [Candidatus Omnitrophica bacterium]|nr:B12-binding domain-containing radical SAM protein [Candidatus Omnitrophota bacterium]
MKIVIIQPPGLMAVDNYSTITQPPLGIAYLAASARQAGHQVKIVDAVGEAVKTIRAWPYRDKRLIQGLNFDEIIQRVPTDTEVIGVSCMFTHAWPMVRQLLHALRASFPRVKLLSGGEHITAMYQMVLSQTPLDFCILGEGEHTLLELLSAFESGTADYSKIQGIAYREAQSGGIVQTARRPRTMNPDELPWPAWDLMDPMAYMANEVFIGPLVGRTIPMLATRGCPYQCTFCSSAQMWTPLWRPRAPEKVADEMEHYVNTYGANDFQFQDLTAIVRKDWILAFCREILRRKLNLTWQLPVGTRSEAIDAEVAEYLMASGCRYISYAPESGSARVLKAIKKHVNLEHLEASARSSLEAGMRVCMLIIVGLPQEAMEDIRTTFAWLRRMARLGVHEVAVSLFVPLPNTELFHDLNKANAITMDDEYCHWMSGATSMWTARSWNPNFSNKKLLFIRLWALAQFYGLSFIYHPVRLWKLIENIFRRRQETKVDRVIREFFIKMPIAIFFRVKNLLGLTTVGAKPQKGSA